MLSMASPWMIQFLTKITMGNHRVFELYHSPRISKLEVHRDEISEMLRLEWPLRKVIEFLHREHGLEVSCNRLWTFCKSRKIEKGRGELPASTENPTKGTPPVKPEPLSPQTSIPALAHESARNIDDVISELILPEDAKNPFTKFKPKP